MNFPSDGPVMTRATEGWEPSTERMYGRDGVLKGDVAMALKVGKEHYMCELNLHTSKSSRLISNESIIPKPQYCIL